MFVKSQDGNYFNLTTASKLRIIKTSTNEDLYFVLLSYDRKEDLIYSTTDSKMADFILEEIINSYSANHKVCISPYNYRCENFEQLSKQNG